MPNVSNLASNVSQILSSIGLGHVGVQHDDELAWVTDTILPAADARRAVAALRAAGYVADDARDGHAAGSWVYVSPPVVEVAAYVDAAGDLMVELPGQRGTVEVREATREEAQESAGTTEGWITTHVARHLLVAVGYLPATTLYSWSTDAASGELQATSVEEAVDELVAQGEWASLDSPREQRDIADGAWLLLHDADGCIVMRRGEV
jgi:hypothetical protein